MGQGIDKGGAELAEMNGFCPVVAGTSKKPDNGRDIAQGKRLFLA